MIEKLLSLYRPIYRQRTSNVNYKIHAYNKLLITHAVVCENSVESLHSTVAHAHARPSTETETETLETLVA